MQKILIFSMFFSFTQSVNGQDEFTNLDRKELTVRIGFSRTSIKDDRMGARPFRAWSRKYDLAYTKINDQRISEIRFQFSRIASNENGLLGLLSIRPNVNYAYQRRMADGFWVGGFWESNTLLNFPKTRSSLFVNNPINYIISNAIGPRITYLRHWHDEGEQRFELRTSAQSSLFSYLIQPAWGHPYPTQYLEEGVFNPRREGMTGPLVRSGIVTTPKRNRGFRIELGFYFFVNNNIRVGIDFQSEVMYFNSLGKAVHFIGNDVFLGASYLH